MSKRYYSPTLDEYIEAPDGTSIDQVRAYEQSLISERGAKSNPADRPLNQIVGLFSGLIPGAIEGAANTVEGIGGMLDSDRLKSVAASVRGNPVSKYFTDRPPELDNAGRYVGEMAGNIATMLLPGGAARAAGAAPRVARGLSALSSMAQSAGEATGEARRNRESGMPVTRDEETTAARLGAIPGLFDLAPLSRLIPGDDLIGRKLASMGTGQMLRRNAATAGIGALTEGSQRAAQNLKGIPLGVSEHPHFLHGVDGLVMKGCLQFVRVVGR